MQDAFTKTPPGERPIRVFRVHGALLATGVNTSLVVEAYSPEEAQETARAQGVLASSIEHLGSHDAGANRGVQTIERTAKVWKSRMATAGGVFLLGVFLFFFGNPQLGVLLALAGGVGFLVVKSMAWWHHG